jgi:hypothetical protein
MSGLREADIILAVNELDAVIMILKARQSAGCMRQRGKTQTVIRHLLVGSFTPEDI